MWRKMVIFMVVALSITVFFPRNLCAGTQEILFSSAMPGLGQLYGGNKLKGLLFMGAEILALHFYFDNLSLYNSMCQDTENLKQEMEVLVGSSYELKGVQERNWQDSFDEAEKKKGRIFPLLGLVGAIWALNIVDVIVFPPQAPAAEPAPAPEEELESLLNSLDYHLVIKNCVPGVQLTYRF